MTSSTSRPAGHFRRAEGVTIKITRRKIICASILLSLLAAAGAAFYKTSCRSQEPRNYHVPKRFLSEVKRLKVESHRLEDEGTPGASLVVVIRNKSDLAVTRLSVTIADLVINRGGEPGSDEPKTVIEPYGTAQFSIPVSNFIDDAPFYISAAVYADGTEEGREEQLKWAHEAERGPKR